MDGLCLKPGILGITAPITVAGEIRANPSHITASAVGRTAASAISSEKGSLSGSPARPWGFSLTYPLRSLFAGNRNRYDAVAVDDTVSVDRKEEKKEESEKKGQNTNWVLKILHVRSLWKEEEDYRIEEVNDHVENEIDDDNEAPGDEECGTCRVDDDGDEDEIEFDKNSFSKLLKRVSLAEARLYAQMSYLGSLAYSIPQIKAGNFLKHHRLRFVTSSVEKKAQLAAKAEKEKASHEGGEEEDTKEKERLILKAEKGIESEEFQEDEERAKQRVENKEKSDRRLISASTAYHIAASAASYLHSHTKSIIPFKPSKNNNDMSENLSETESVNPVSDHVSMRNAEVASLMATTDSVTAVVAAKEDVKQAVADDLNSTHSSPCEWFICDDDESSTRYFVIQGSESLASWQANLLFEPIQFEAMDVIVHRGIYEAAKGIYEQMLPEVHEHLQRHGNQANFRFTGHSLGGSLSLLVNLMLLIRGQVPRSSLLPVITFGAPTVMCGGDQLLHNLGLPKSHLQAITLHRDIVPRAFSCNYPSRVADLLKAVNGNFRNHPCLNSQNLLYAPMGEMLILQPDAKFSPSHDLLPSGTGMYLLTSSSEISDAKEAEKQIRNAQSVFLNTPHPLEILSDRSAYGSEGAIQRDHDMESYVISVRSVIRQELNRVRKERREHRRKVWWPTVVPRRRPGQSQLKFLGVLETGRESLKRFSTMVASQHMHLLVVLLLPARLLILEACNVIRC